MLKLLPPTPARPHFHVAGRYLGVRVRRSTHAASEREARGVLRRIKEQIERGEYRADDAAHRGDGRDAQLTFVKAAVAYMKAGGERRFLSPIIELTGAHAIRDLPLDEIDQIAIDNAAEALYPRASAATKNRQFYTPVAAVLHHAGCVRPIKRPKGHQGKTVRKWMWPEQAFRLLDAMRSIDHELWIFGVLLLYGGARLSEPLKLRCCDVKLDEAFAYIPDSKNGDPMPMHLTPLMIEALRSHPRGLDRGQERLFRFHKGGALKFKLVQARAIASGLPKPRVKKIDRKTVWPELPPHELDFVTWHIFRHTFGTWGRRYLGWDGKDMVDTGRWKSEKSTARYAHTVASETLEAIERLPVPALAPAIVAQPERSDVSSSGPENARAPAAEATKARG